MNNLNGKKKINKSIIVLSLAVLLVILGSTYALLTYDLVGTKDYTITGRNLSIELDDSDNGDLTMSDAIPVPDFMGLKQSGYNFTIKNNDMVDFNYDVSVVNNPENTITDDSVIKYAIREQGSVEYTKGLLSDLDNRIILTGNIKAGESKSYNLKFWFDEMATNEQILNKTFSVKLSINAKQEVTLAHYKEILNGNTPIIKDPLVPVIIESDGTVKRYEDTDGWYDYEKSIWANAVILKSDNDYNINEVIPEDDIESYFVWIPKFDYQIFNMGNYTSLTTLTDATQIINVRFSENNTTDSDTECNYPVLNNQATDGATGSCSVGKWMTHPAFTTMGTNGFWVGKFETGYDGATSTEGAQVNSLDTSKIIIKPNVYSWRNITVGNIFNVSYNYNRRLDSHMMKNTEWGAMAYLSASKYGYKDEISTGAKRTTAIINNNSSFITGYASTEEPTVGYKGSSIAGNRRESTALKVDGTYTKNYLNTYSQLASTTGNYSGVYDTSGGAWEYVSGYTTGASTVGGSSGITSLYTNFFGDMNYLKYWDKYSSTANTNYNKRILGDVTGEMGPFQSTTDPDNNSRYKSSWNNDYAAFVYSSSPWFARGGDFSLGIAAGSFAFTYGYGAVGTEGSFRVVLTP